MSDANLEFRAVLRLYLKMKKYADSMGKGPKLNNLIKTRTGISPQRLSDFTKYLPVNGKQPPKTKASGEMLYVHEIIKNVLQSEGFQIYRPPNALELRSGRDDVSIFVKENIVDAIGGVLEGEDIPDNEVSRMLFHMAFSRFIDKRNNVRISNHFSGANCLLQKSQSRVVSSSSIYIQKSPYFDLWVFQKLSKISPENSKTLRTRGVCFVSGEDVPVYYFLGLRDTRVRSDQHISLSILQQFKLEKRGREGSILTGLHHTFDLSKNSISSREIGMKNARELIGEGTGREFIGDPTPEHQNWFSDLKLALEES